MNNTKQNQRRTFIKNVVYTAGGLALVSRMSAPWAKSQGYRQRTINDSKLAVNFGDSVVSSEVIDLTIASQEK
jgi:hypothetical protein